MAKVGFGTTLNWGGNVVASLNNIGAPELSIDMLDVTTHQSTSGFKEFIAGLKDGGEIAVAGEVAESDTNGQVAMVTDAAAGTSRTTIITPADTTFSWTFTGLISKIKFGDAPHDGKIPFSATIKVSGVPVLAISAVTGITAMSISNSAVLYPSAWAVGTYDYDATVLTGVSSVTFTPTAAGQTITIESGGVSQTIATGATSAAVTLGAAGSRTPVKLTAQQSGKVSKVYNVDILRA